MSERDVGFDKGLIVVATTFRADIYCLRCEVRHFEHHASPEVARLFGSPMTTDPAAWRAYLTRLGWTEGGTVCLGCSKFPEATDDR